MAVRFILNQAHEGLRHIILNQAHEGLRHICDKNFVFFLIKNVSISIQ